MMRGPENVVGQSSEHMGLLWAPDNLQFNERFSIIMVKVGREAPYGRTSKCHLQLLGPKFIKGRHEQGLSLPELCSEAYDQEIVRSSVCLRT